jgi:DNA-binding CsgD family transcriptional regulator
LAFAAAHDLDRLRLYMLGWWAVTHLRLGRRAEAVAAAGEVLDRPGVSTPSRITALSALGLARARAGEPGAFEALDEAMELARPIGSLHRVGLAAAARAEAAWLAGDPARAEADTRAAYDLALIKRHRWFAGELGLWLRCGGAALDPPEWAAEPFRAEINGDWRRAAAAWERLRCPYEMARALAGGDEAAQRDALLRFEELGARPAAGMLRQQLRAAGATHIPRGPRPATREHPFGLTNRQMEIAALLAEGLTNAQIAARLQLSPKTVDHHVSAVLAKLDVRTREEAGEVARGWQVASSR